jgi:adenosylmethionine-8-amino-7-oxononanoate aminotransferase
MPRVVAAYGDRLRLADGTEWIDAAAGAIVGNIGWGRDDVAEAIANSTRTRTYALPDFETQERLELVTELRTAWLPPELTQLYFASGGSEAIDAAIRLARLHHALADRPTRWKIIGRNVSYHGTTLSSLSVGGHAARRKHFGPLLNDLPKAPSCFCLRCPLELEYPSCGIACAHELEAILHREDPDTVAAFIAEPIVGSSGGAIVPPDEYWPAISAICRRHGVLLIVDEILTGFGRTGRRFAVNHWNISPDIMVLGKGLCGGYAALSAVAATREVVEPLVRNQHPLMFYTYGGLPSACAAANAVLKIIENERLLHRVAANETVLRTALERLRSYPNVADVRGRGYLWAVELVQSRRNLTRFPVEFNATKRIIEFGKRRGVLFYGGGTEEHRDIVMIAPHFISDRQTLDFIVHTLGEAIECSLTTHVGHHNEHTISS